MIHQIEQRDEPQRQLTTYHAMATGKTREQLQEKIQSFCCDLFVLLSDLDQNGVTAATGWAAIDRRVATEPSSTKTLHSTLALSLEMTSPSPKKDVRFILLQILFRPASVDTFQSDRPAFRQWLAESLARSLCASTTDATHSVVQALTQSTRIWVHEDTDCIFKLSPNGLLIRTESQTPPTGDLWCD
jgi:hypothetical protein